MITEDRIKHILGVARRCREIAEEQNRDAEFCDRMFVIGFLHDIGYEFSDNRGHAVYGAEMLGRISLTETDINAIRDHGKPLPAEEQSLQLRILNQADNETSSMGERVTALQRLQGIEERYGRDSVQYWDMERLCEELGLFDCSHKFSRG